MCFLVFRKVPWQPIQLKFKFNLVPPSETVPQDMHHINSNSLYIKVISNNIRLHFQ